MIHRPPANEPAHLSLAKRKALTARLIALEELEPAFTAHAGSLPIKNLLDQVREEVFGSTTDELLTPRNNEQLDAYVQGVSRALQMQIQLPLYARYHASLNPIITSITTRSTQLSCQACHGSTVCTGGLNDAQIVAQSGHCIQRLTQLLDWASTVAKEHYERYAGVTTSWPKIVFATDAATKKPHAYNAPIYASARTLECLLGERMVELTLWVERFDWPTYLALPYILLHETFIHVPENLFASERDPRADNPYTEGWMDWVALQVLEDVANGEGASGRHQGDLSFASFHSQEARGLHHARVAFRDPASPEVCAMIAQGRFAAVKLFNTLQHPLTADGRLARDWFFEISLYINMLPTSDLDRRHFVSKIWRYCPSPGGVPDPLFYTGVIPLVQEFKRHRDIRRFFYGISGLE